MLGECSRAQQHRRSGAQRHEGTAALYRLLARPRAPPPLRRRRSRRARAGCARAFRARAANLTTTTTARQSASRETTAHTVWPKAGSHSPRRREREAGLRPSPPRRDGPSAPRRGGQPRPLSLPQEGGGGGGGWGRGWRFWAPHSRPSRLAFSRPSQVPRHAVAVGDVGSQLRRAGAATREPAQNRVRAGRCGEGRAYPKLAEVRHEPRRRSAQHEDACQRIGAA